jgi:hypothetical protein
MSLNMTMPTGRLVDHQKRAHAYASYQAQLREKAVKAAAAAFDFPTRTVGATPDGSVSVYYDPRLGQPGVTLAQQVLSAVGGGYTRCQSFFNVEGQPVRVIIAALNGETDGSGGAYHYGCDFKSGGDIYCDAAFGDPALTIGLFVAELAECFMGLQNRGWNCGASNGEALSRFLAEQASDGCADVMAAYESALQWDAAGRPDWIDATEPTDQDLVSVGCGVVYLYWMLSKGYTAAQIAQAGCPDGTLSSNYTALTGRASAWNSFQTALAALNAPIRSDNPWRNALALQPAAPVALAGGQIVIDTAARTVTLPAGWNAQNDNRTARANG